MVLNGAGEEPPTATASGYGYIAVITQGTTV